MLLIAAALAEELRMGLDLCNFRTRFRVADAGFWSGSYCGHKILFLKTGIGIRRSSKKLEALLSSRRPDRILLIGYAGALAPELRIGDLTILQRISSLGDSQTEKRALEEIEVGENYDLHGSSELLDLAHGAGLTASCGAGLTSPWIVGDPDQKRFLHRKFLALTIDMETAAIARVALRSGIPFASVRAISDQADDKVLVPFSYDPDSTAVSRAIRVLGAGKWGERYSSWRKNAGKARESLRTYLRFCLETWANCDPASSWLRS